jgi:glucose-6-phosphate isomerase
MKIHFDDTNLFAEMVGEADGVTLQEFQRATPQAMEALQSFQNASEEGRYGFPHLPFQTQNIREILSYASGVRGSYDTVCLVGIGGSALGAWALDCGLRGPHPVQPAFSAASPRLVILDNVDPSFVHSALESMNPRKTVAVCVAKSGSTAETVATFLVVKEWLESKLGRKTSDRISIVTSAAGGGP